jgi:hypothetical protein
MAAARGERFGRSGRPIVRVVRPGAEGENDAARVFLQKAADAMARRGRVAVQLVESGNLASIARGADAPRAALADLVLTVDGSPGVPHPGARVLGLGASPLGLPSTERAAAFASACDGFFAIGEANRAGLAARAGLGVCGLLPALGAGAEGSAEQPCSPSSSPIGPRVLVVDARGGEPWLAGLDAALRVWQSLPGTVRPSLRLLVDVRTERRPQAPGLACVEATDDASLDRAFRGAHLALDLARAPADVGGFVASAIARGVPVVTTRPRELLHDPVPGLSAAASPVPVADPFAFGLVGLALPRRPLQVQDRAFPSTPFVLDVDAGLAPAREALLAALANPGLAARAQDASTRIRAVHHVDRVAAILENAAFSIANGVVPVLAS